MNHDGGEGCDFNVQGRDKKHQICVERRGDFEDKMMKM